MTEDRLIPYYPHHPHQRCLDCTDLNGRLILGMREQRLLGRIAVDRSEYESLGIYLRPAYGGSLKAGPLQYPPERPAPVVPPLETLADIGAALAAFAVSRTKVAGRVMVGGGIGESLGEAMLTLMDQRRSYDDLLP
jgi:hypothetical protein